MKNTDFEKHLSAFLTTYLVNERNRSANTIQAYVQAFKQLRLFLILKQKEKKHAYNVRRLEISDLKHTTILAFLDWIEIGRGCGIKTRNLRLAALKSFCYYVLSNDYKYTQICHKIIDINKKKEVDKLPTSLSTNGISLLLDQPDQTTAKGRRDLTLLSVMYDAGARVQEIIDLTPADLVFKNRPWVTLTGKGGKKRLIALTNNLKATLKFYLHENKLDQRENESNPLFFGAGGEKFTRAGITYILRKHLRGARAQDKAHMISDQVSCHSLRHSKAIHLLEAGVDIVHIRDILGHKSVKTTEKYAMLGTAFKEKALKKVYKNFTPGIKPKNADPDSDWLNDFLNSYN